MALIDFEDPEMPAVIRGLRPSYLFLHENGVKVEMGGGFHNFGVLALPEGSPDTLARGMPSARELVPGLWYYEDDE